MKAFLHNNWKIVSAIVFLECVFFAILLSGRLLVPFQAQNYQNFTVKYFVIPARSALSNSLVQDLNVYDAQRYISLAKNGYLPIQNKLQFAYFPLYPLLLSTIHALGADVVVSAFISSQALFFAIILSLLFVIGAQFGKSVAEKTVVLLLFFPFSIFLRSYYTEGLFLFELIWFVYFWTQKKWFKAAVLLGLLMITRGAAFLLFPALLYSARKNKKGLFISCLALIPIGIWSLLCWQWTGDPIVFLHVRTAWTHTAFPLLRTLATLVFFPFIPLHDFHASKIDDTILILTAVLLWKSKKILPKEWWWTSFLLWVTPLIASDTMSFSRFQSISFPLFTYLALKLSRKKFLGVAVTFFILLCVVGILFINYYWIG